MTFFYSLPDELEWSNYTRPRVEADSSRWKFRRGRWMSTRLYNKMNEREGYAHYRYGVCNDTSHNRKICHNQQRMYDKTNI